MANKLADAMADFAKTLRHDGGDPRGGYRGGAPRGPRDRGDRGDHGDRSGYRGGAPRDHGDPHDPRGPRGPRGPRDRGDRGDRDDRRGPRGGDCRGGARLQKSSIPSYESDCIPPVLTIKFDGKGLKETHIKISVLNEIKELIIKFSSNVNDALSHIGINNTMNANTANNFKREMLDFLNNPVKHDSRLPIDVKKIYSWENDTIRNATGKHDIVLQRMMLSYILLIYEITHLSPYLKKTEQGVYNLIVAIGCLAGLCAYYKQKSGIDYTSKEFKAHMEYLC